MNPAGSLLHAGQAVSEGLGPLHCSATGRDGRVCGAFVGMPAVGSILVQVEPSAYLSRAERGFYAFRCPKCGAGFMFALPPQRKEAP